MPISSEQFYRLNAALLVLGLAVLLTIVGVSLYLTSKNEGYFAQVVAIREVRSSTADLLYLVQSAETSQRGFLLVRDEAYLAPYDEAVAEFDGALERLEGAVAGFPALADDAAGMRELLKSKIAELARTVVLAREGRFDEAVDIVQDGSGANLMGQIRARMTTLLEMSDADLRQAIAAQSSAAAWLRYVTIAGALAILAMVAAVAWTLFSYTRDLDRARKDVEIANTALEERVRERTQDLIRANEEIQRFAYIVTHDLRAPLVNIMGFTSELEAMFEPVHVYLKSDADNAEARTKASAALDEEVPEAIGFIRSATQKMDGLINAILKISREGRRPLQPQPIDLAKLLEGAAAAVHHQASADGAGIRVESRAGTIVSDRLSLDQVFGNLLDNAIKYRSPDRPIEIVARSYRDRRGGVVIEFEDNGRGIAPSDHERIFELFRRSGRQNTAGEGIGLTHVRTLVRSLGGDITVRSELHKGSVFTITLPADLNKVKRSADT